MLSEVQQGACVYSNATLYGVEDDSARYTWAGWRLIVLLTSLFGDSTILVASIKYGAIKVHPGLVPFIQHLAVCDLILATTYVFPGMVSLLADGWVLGQVVCLGTAYLSYYLFSLGCFLMAGLTSGKLMMIQCPMKAREWTEEKSHKICTATWVLCFALPLALSIVDGTDACFDSRKYNCTYGYTSEIWVWLKPAAFFIMALTPGITIVATSILLLRKAAIVSRESLRWQGMLTVLVTAAVYMLSILPFVAHGIAEPFLEKDPTKVTTFQFNYYRVACAFLSFHVMANFFVYSLTMPSLRDFVREMSRRGRNSVVRATWAHGGARTQVENTEITVFTYVR